MTMKWSAHMPAATSAPMPSSMIGDRRSGGIQKSCTGSSAQPTIAHQAQACGPPKRRVSTAMS